MTTGWHLLSLLLFLSTFVDVEGCYQNCVNKKKQIYRKNHNGGKYSDNDIPANVVKHICTTCCRTCSATCFFGGSRRELLALDGAIVEDAAVDDVTVDDVDINKAKEREMSKAYAYGESSNKHRRLTTLGCPTLDENGLEKCYTFFGCNRCGVSWNDANNNCRVPTSTGFSKTYNTCEVDADCPSNYPYCFSNVDCMWCKDFEVPLSVPCGQVLFTDNNLRTLEGTMCADPAATCVGGQCILGVTIPPDPCLNNGVQRCSASSGWCLQTTTNICSDLDHYECIEADCEGSTFDNQLYTTKAWCGTPYDGIRCGTTWDDANWKCGQACALDENCPTGQKCFGELDTTPCLAKVNTFTLTNNVTGAVIRSTVANGAVIDVSPATSVRAFMTANPSTTSGVGSIMFSPSWYGTSTDSYTPYTTAAYTFTAGRQYMIKATTYTGKLGKGYPGKSYTISFAIVSNAVAQKKCSYGAMTSGFCTAGEPCCSQYGYCGSGYLYCGVGCQVTKSYTSTSCSPVIQELCTNTNGLETPTYCDSEYHCCDQYGDCRSYGAACGTGCQPLKSYKRTCA